MISLFSNVDVSVATNQVRDMVMFLHRKGVASGPPYWDIFHVQPI